MLLQTDKQVFIASDRDVTHVSLGFSSSRPEGWREEKTSATHSSGLKHWWMSSHRCESGWNRLIGATWNRAAVNLTTGKIDEQNNLNTGGWKQTAFKLLTTLSSNCVLFMALEGWPGNTHTHARAHISHINKSLDALCVFTAPLRSVIDGCSITRSHNATLGSRSLALPFLSS